VAKRRKAKRRSNEKGQVIEVTLPVHASNVSLLGKDKKPTRVSVRKTEKGRERIAKKGGMVIA
jgi:ribosomal protein L24